MVPVKTIPTGFAHLKETHCRQALLFSNLHVDPTYDVDLLEWYKWDDMEHGLCQVSIFPLNSPR
jgi:hypothetical protein